MQLRTMEAVSVVHQIRCDRCGKKAERGGLGFAEMMSKQEFGNRTATDIAGADSEDFLEHVRWEAVRSVGHFTPALLAQETHSSHSACDTSGARP